MARVFSGVQPTGEGPHIGNYLGAFRRWVDLQDDLHASGGELGSGAPPMLFYCVVDLHALTLPWDPAALREGVRRTAATLLATGIDPAKSVLFVQSDVAEHAELMWILTCLAKMGELGRMTQYKEKGRGDDQAGTGAGIFLYPVLMAADVLTYRAHQVPVGEDQRQHLELMRDLAERFNNRFGETFPVPEPVIGRQGARIMALDDPTQKMSKSSERPGSAIGMLDPPETVKAKLARAVTDSGREIRHSPDKPAVSNLLEILSGFSGTAIPELEASFDGQGYAALKTRTTEAIVAVLTPFQQRYGELMADPGELDRLLDGGAHRARAVAAETLQVVRAKVGLRPGALSRR
ncbi:MAG TPA: tryptophan--tRNA ligase [Actinomycetota bacterium]|nr:tryptophan--tRNA ligase [Actinomycetota bacterium]